MFQQLKSVIEATRDPEVLSELGKDVPRAKKEGRITEEEFRALVEIGKKRREILRQAEEIRKQIEPAGGEDPFSQELGKEFLASMKKAESQEEIKSLFDDARDAELNRHLTPGETCHVIEAGFSRLHELAKGSDFHPLTKSLLDRLQSVQAWEAYDQAMEIAWWRMWEERDFGLLEDAFALKFQALKRKLPREPLPRGDK